MRKNTILFTVFYIFLGCVPLQLHAQTNEADREAIFNHINADRAKLGLGPLNRWREIEDCLDASTKVDTGLGTPHASSKKCSRGVQNTCGGSSLSDVLELCLPAFLNEGPPPSGVRCVEDCFLKHGHYINMTSPKYSKVGIGIYKNESEQKYWVNMDFG